MKLPLLLNLDNHVRWSAILAVFEILQMIRYFILKEDIQKIGVLLGSNPNSSMISAYFYCLALLALLRLVFCLRPRDRKIAFFNAAAHVTEIIPVTALVVMNILMPMWKNGFWASWEAHPEHRPYVGVYWIIIFNGYLYWSHYKSIGDVILSRTPSRSLSAERSLSRGGSFDRATVSPPESMTNRKKKVVIVKKTVVKKRGASASSKK